MPTDAFSLIGAHLRERDLIPEWIDPDRFAHMRWAAERAARSRRLALWGQPEVSIEEIYGVMHQPLAGVAIEACVNVELTVEETLLLPDDSLIALLGECANSGLQTALVSDTYFSSSQVAQLLRKVVPPDLLTATKIFTSSEFRCGKSDGLFVQVLGDLHVLPTEMVHIGDNALSDLAAARRHGIQAVAFERTPEWLRRISAREGFGELQEPEAPPTNGCRSGGGSVDLGLTALRRLAAGTPDAASRPTSIAMITSVFGPALAAFATWVVESATARGFSKISCLMREGALLEPLIAQEAAVQETGLTTSQLWLSRLVCARAAIQTCSYDELLPLVHRRRPITVGELIRELCGYEVTTSFVAKNADRLLGDVAFIHEVSAEIAATPEIVGIAQSRAERLRRVLVDHLEPHREPDGSLLLVDLGWACTTQYLLNRALALAGCPSKTVGFYLATTDAASPRVLDGLECQSFLALGQAQVLARSPEPLEQLGIGDDGSLIDLRADGLVTAPNQIPPSQRGEAALLREAILEFQAHWHRARATNPTLGRLASDGRELVGNALVKMLESPTPEEAQFFGSWVHDDNFGSKADADLLVGRLTLQEAGYASPSQLRSLPHRVIPWPGVTVEQAGPRVRAFGTSLQVRDGDRRKTTAGEAGPGPGGRSLAVLASDVDQLREVAVQLTDVPAILRIDRVRIVCEEERTVSGEEERTVSEVVFEPHDRTLHQIVAEGLSAIEGFRELFLAQPSAPHLRWRPPGSQRPGSRIRHVLVVVSFSSLPTSGSDGPVPASRPGRRRWLPRSFR